MSDKPLNPERLPEYNEFVRFTAFPAVIRKREWGFFTDSDFAKKFEINKDTLAIWKGREQFWSDVGRQLKIWGKGQTPDVVMGLYRNVVAKGGAAEAKLWHELFEDFKERSETTHKIEGRKAIQAIQESMRTLITQEKGKKK